MAGCQLAFVVGAAALATTLPTHHRSALGRLDSRHGGLDPGGRLPDFSWAGYHAGDDPLPSVRQSANVRDFGARGDGFADDTTAFRRALAEASPGAILVPRGRYRLSSGLALDRSGLVLRGEGSGPGGTTLFFTSGLADIQGLTELPASNELSWSGGLVHVEGQGKEHRLTPVIGSARRGERRLHVTKADAIRAGDLLFLRLDDDEKRSLEQHLTGGPALGAGNCAASVLDSPFKVAAVEGDLLVLSQPLRTDVRPEWRPTVWRMTPVREVGVEHLTIEFPPTPYPGHHRERGLNAIDIGRNVVDGWIRDVAIRNCDSGVFVGRRSKWITITGLAFTSSRSPDPRGDLAHHGVALSGCSDVLVADVRFATEFIHELTLSHRATGNVFSGPMHGASLDLDHHRDAPFENLFQDLAGNLRFQDGGKKCYGPPAGVRNTYWALDGMAPPSWLGPGAVVVGTLAVHTREKQDADRWIEHVDGLEPRDLHAAQLSRRRAAGVTVGREDMANPRR